MRNAHATTRLSSKIRGIDHQNESSVRYLLHPHLRPSEAGNSSFLIPNSQSEGINFRIACRARVHRFRTLALSLARRLSPA